MECFPNTHQFTGKEIVEGGSFAEYFMGFGPAWWYKMDPVFFPSGWDYGTDLWNFLRRSGLEGEELKKQYEALIEAINLLSIFLGDWETPYAPGGVVNLGQFIMANRIWVVFQDFSVNPALN
ncbi:hypothetical protein DRP53_07110 [candidate division WOR-3 bacterium]|uniref:Uncharacterized protein n=1 Tax=candidate division WOR-3 bacterium TaxID=2052148 RepID=A0A660SGE9_UNCW3|nr:MAG: hypothetical protein DRP53_07110 [candidate division WOR-3 bacterium]